MCVRASSSLLGAAVGLGSMGRPDRRGASKNQKKKGQKNNPKKQPTGFPFFLFFRCPLRRLLANAQNVRPLPQWRGRLAGKKTRGTPAYCGPFSSLALIIL
jgi:hypothetical protein